MSQKHYIHLENQEKMIYELLTGNFQLLLWHQQNQEIDWNYVKIAPCSRKTLHKYNKFLEWIDENNEASCWALICNETYHENIFEGVREKVVDFCDKHSHGTILDRKHFFWKCLFRGIYL